MDPLLNFTGQVALITGAASGFGRLLAKGLAERGAKLVLSDINETALEEVQTELQPLTAVEVIAGNIAEETLNKALVELAIEKFGRLDIAVNNAGIAHTPAPVHEMTEAIMDSQFAVNVKGVMFGMKYQIPAMLSQKKGHVLNVSSLAGLGGAPKGAAYAAAKHAVAGVTRTAAVEYGRKNVRVNAICPFYSPTNILNVDGYNTPEAQAQLGQGSPMKRLGEPQEIVNTMLLMLSPGNSYMNGQTVAVDGGVTAW
ncbi:MULTISPECIES: SDR family NAD(P)-dependent oxidoreductase [Alteromonas]|jgi:NAD(P)-dependent dehydrogenase (short-subunit alcohol dehydrogenase family)|uniref:Glucose 1-dehydrogenase n=1 Tax=Alteromonas hispanica TaxID=315421 RepID=A0A6L9MVT3_9ALTE|nr:MULTISPECIES: glucose 1-dehydrogenase [Alteromonas]APE07664.1 3-oxoacyl-ACP reductase [Alteromonas sp. RW2A1]NDW22288.1 glucose 1-dehydrogenase [Alteromonas hispanica]